MESDDRPLTPNPQAEANWCSKITFWWTNGILRLGYQRHLEARDLYDVLPEDSSIKLASGIGREWEKELYIWKSGGQPSLDKALLRRYGSHIFAVGVVFLVVEAFRIVQALLLGLIVTYFEPGSKLTRQQAYIGAGCWTICYVLVLVLDNFAFHKSYYFGLKMRVACTSLIYRKLLCLSYKSLQDTKATDLVHLIAADAQRFDQSCLGLSYIWIAPIEAIVIMLLLWIYLGLGATSLIGLFVLAILTPVQYLMGRFLSKLRLQLYHLTERRVSVMNEILTGIRTIKINCWERAFTTLIKAIRRSEWTYIRVMSHIRGINSAMFFISGKLLMFVTFVSYTLLGGSCTPSTVYTAMALYEILRTTVSLLLPWGIQHYTEIRSATKNIQEYLLLEEKSCQDLPQGYDIQDESEMNLPLPENTAVQFRDFSATWIKEKSFILENINFTVETGQYVAITGPAGCGKSSILLAIAGELPRLGGFVRSRGKLGLVTQTPCLFPGTIRDNILFGSDLDWRRYNKVLHSCGVLQDVEHFVNGDLSVIGESGLNLTDGHKCRICLARAVYQSRDIYLIDDIFSQMEPHSAVHIFTKCFCGIISTKTILLVTQNLRLIKAADQIIMLDRGKIVHQGSYDDIQSQGVEIEKILLTYQYYQESRQSQDSDNEDQPDREPSNWDIYASHMSILRQRSGLDSSYGSSESLDQIILEYDHGTSDTDVTDDDTEVSSVHFRLYVDYLRLNGCVCSLSTFVILCLVSQAAYIVCDWWLFVWVQSQNRGNVTSSSQLMDPSTHLLAFFPFTAHVITPNTNFYIYLSIFLGFVLCGFLRSLSFSLMTSRTARTMHDDAYNSMMRAPLSFFERNAVSRILPRFSRDVSIIDDSLSATYFDCIQFALLVIGAGLFTMVINYWLILVVLPVCALFVVITRYYMVTARQVKKLELAAKTPIYQHVTNTLHGIRIIRSFDAVSRFLRIFDNHEDRYTAASYMYIAVQRWFSLRLDIFGVLIVSLLAFLSVTDRHLIDPGLLGMALVYVINVMGLFQYTMRQSAELELQMTSLERLKSYLKLPSEGAIICSPRPAPSWPQYGIVTFEGYTMAAPDGCKCLKNVWGCIRAEEKVGILSKDENSQKAIVSAILRLEKPCKGILRIDGLDTSKIGLLDLRERISHVDEDPVLFTGSLRRNLDPFTRHPDAGLWSALEDVGLKARVQQIPGHLYADVAECSSWFDQGDRQLLGLARALLLNTKIVIYEEALSVIDKHTAAVIRYTLDSKFAHKTVIVLAREVDTVINMDRVMILEDAKIKEFDPPHQLLQNRFSLFSRLVRSQPERKAALLRKLAQDKYEKRPYRPPPQPPGGDTSKPYTGRTGRHFLPSFQSTRLTGVLSHFTGNRYSTNRF